MLIIEGSDHLGKTTACKRLVELAEERALLNIEANLSEYAYPIRYQHMDRPNIAFNFLGDYQDMLSKFAVQDRFHLGGLVWHEDMINLPRLRFIEAWISVLGSYTVIFAIRDESQYRYMLKTNPKPERFDTEILVNANKKFLAMIDGKFCPTPFIDTGVLIGWKDGKPLWPNDKVLNQILDGWYARLRLLER